MNKVKHRDGVRCKSTRMYSEGMEIGRLGLGKGG